MNKPYYPGQPPPPPGAPGQPYDAYTTWQAQAAAAQQQYYQTTAASAAGPPAPTSNPYANYGYGPNVSWAHQHHHPAHRPPVPPPIPAPPPVPQATPYGPYQPHAQPPPPPPSVYPPRPAPGSAGIGPQNQPPPPPPVPRPPYQQPPLKRQRIHSLPGSAQSRFPPLPSSTRSADTTATPISGPQPAAFNRQNRSGAANQANSGGPNRSRNNVARPMRGGRPGSNNRHNAGSRSSGSTPRGPRRNQFGAATGGSKFPRFEMPQSHNGWGNGPVTSTSTPVAPLPSDREGKRTLTDFRIVGFGFVTEHTTWSWGTTRPVNDLVVFSQPNTGNNEGPLTFPSLESPVSTKQEDESLEQGASVKDKGKKPTKENARIRIYFHPASLLGARTNGAAGALMPPPPSGVPSRSAKRKKSESEEDDGERGNAKRHHGDSDNGPRSASVAGNSMLAMKNGKDSQDAPSSDIVEPAPPALLHDVEQSSEVSNEVDWLGDALKEEGEDGELEADQGEHDSEKDDGDDDGLQVEIEHDTAPEYLDQVEEEEEATSLFGSGVHPSPPPPATASADNNDSADLIVQPVDESVLEVDSCGPENEKSAAMQGPTSNDLVVDGDESRLSPTACKPAANLQPPFGGASSGAGGPGGAGNKLSVSFAASRRRLVLEAEVIKYLKVFRAEGRIEFSASLELVSPSHPEPDASSIADDDAKPVIKGVCMEVWNEADQTFQSVTIPSPSSIGPSSSSSSNDSTLPPLYGATTVTFHVFLDLENPLSVPRWVKTGDVDDWLQTMFGVSSTLRNNSMLFKKEEGTESKGWEGKITVMDPDPAPTLQNLLDTWATNSLIAQQKDREAFLKACFYQTEGSADDKKEYNMDNVMEILLRLIRGDRLLIGSTPSDFHHHHHHYHHNSANNTVHPILQAAVGSDTAALLNQTHSSLAVLAIFRVLQQTAQRFGGEEAKKEVEGRVKEIIKCLPHHMINKSLDGMFQKWSGANTSQGGSKTTNSLPAKVHR